MGIDKPQRERWHSPKSLDLITMLVVGAYLAVIAVCIIEEPSILKSRWLLLPLGIGLVVCYVLIERRNSRQQQEEDSWRKSQLAD